MNILFLSIMTFLLISCLSATRLVCYTTNWSQYRPEPGRFFPENIDPSLCTHLIYAFAVLKDGLISAFEWNDESTSNSKGLYERTTDLKKLNPNLKVLLAVGGWNFGPAQFSNLVSNTESVRRFVQHSVQFLKRYNFDGLDIDWEYPANREGSRPEDKINFTKFIQELKNVFVSENLMLTAALAASKSVIDSAYEIDKIIKNLDFINIMTYDYHGAWESVTGLNAPFYSRPEETGEMKFFNVNFTINYYIQKGAPRDKINIGLATYGRSFKLVNSNENQIGSPSNGPGSAGEFTREAGFLASYEICKKLIVGWTQRWSQVQKAPYAFSNDQWVGFDNEQSYDIKINFMKNLNLGGAMIWAIDMDDFNGEFCRMGNYPVINFIKEKIFGENLTTTTKTTSTSSTTKPNNKCPNGTGTYADKDSNCRKFYVCSLDSQGNYRIEIFDCPADLLFDDKIKICNYPNQVICLK
ncbi:unnamed protein product [Brachionus calyciflorus]|uniref:Chitinase n=1 Tax=Brachionus calyciflorus TaxID=104777 RepID=A0A813W5R2_9BILA|nr:unnamed protein product [Brachionus calyciflorus]